LTFEQPVRCATDAGATLPRTYIACTEPRSDAFAPFAARARTDAAWRYRGLLAGHDAMVTMPLQLAALLREIAEAGDLSGG
jgi:hypothetical protein